MTQIVEDWFFFFYKVKATEVSKWSAIWGDQNVKEKGKPESQGFRWRKRRRHNIWQEAVCWIPKLIRGRLWLVWFACKKRNTLMAKIKLVCFPARQQFNIKTSLSTCVWMTDYIKYTQTHTAATVSRRYCLSLHCFLLHRLECFLYILYKVGLC